MSVPSPDEVQLWLEWSGERLMALRVSGLHPQEFRSFWPQYADDPLTAYGYTSPRLRIPPPSAAEIPLMDEIIALILIIPDPIQRQILQARSLIRPLSGTYLYSWSKIARKIHSERRRVKVLHGQGLGVIAGATPCLQVEKIRIGTGLSPSET